MRVTFLKNHKLIKSLVPLTSGYISRHDPDSRLLRLKPTKKEEVAIDFLISLGNITDCVDQLHFTVELLSGFHKRKVSLFNRHDYIVYMIENFYLRITSIFDRCLILTNRVFDIGLTEKECKESTIINNTKVNQTKVKENLQNINKFINEYKQIRNRLAHVEGLQDDQLNNIQVFYYLLDSDQSEEFQKFKHLYKKEADHYVFEKKEDLYNRIRTIEGLVDEFFTSLIPYVNMRIDSNKKD